MCILLTERNEERLLRFAYGNFMVTAHTIRPTTNS